MLLQAALFLAIVWGSVLLLATVVGLAYVVWRWRLLMADLKQAELEAKVAADEPVEVPTDEAMHRLLTIARNQDHILRDAWATEKIEDGWTQEEIETFLEHRPEIELN